MGNRSGDRCSGPKCVAIVGPFASGKTTLLEALLARTGTIPRQNQIGSGQTVGDHSAESRAHAMSVEACVATTAFMGEPITFIDCPGSVEFAREADAVIAACDLAVVVAEADEKKIPALQVIMRQLEAAGVPRVMFLNKADKMQTSVRDALKLMQRAVSAPLLLRHIALRSSGSIVGSIDLALERAYVWRDHAPSEIAEIPADDRARETEARFSMLETLADHDDVLMEQLLADTNPAPGTVFDDLAADLRQGSVTPVLIGSAERGHGTLRLLKTIRHDAPDATQTRQRLGIADGDNLYAHVMKTIHTPHGGKLSVARILSGKIADGTEVRSSRGTEQRVSGLYVLQGKEQAKAPTALAGDTVALGKLEGVATGDALAGGKGTPSALPAIAPPAPVVAKALRARERKDDVRLSAALQRLAEEDPALSVAQNQDTGETLVSGQGEMHLRVTIERLEGKYQIPVEARDPIVPYLETIRRAATQRGRHKKQSGGHGQFGDVVLEIRPLARGAGFVFTDTITGGVVPRQYIQSVETGVREFLKSGHFGFPVTDIAVNLSDGSYHSVDSSDMAFQMAARLAMKEALEQASPVLLEPVMRVQIETPSDATARVTAIVPQRRGQILGFDARPGWQGWDIVEAVIPQASIGSLIVDLRSVTAGVGTYRASFDHMAELTGRLADEAVLRGKAA